MTQTLSFPYARRAWVERIIRHRRDETMQITRIATPEQAARARRSVRTLTCTLALALMPVIALAQHDDDEKPTPIDPKTAAAQNQIIGVIILLIVLALGWYWFRRWQIVRASRHQGDRQE